MISSRILEFFYFDAGGGHRSAATALKQIIAEHYPNWRVEMVNLQDLLRSIDPVFRFTNIKSENIYNGLVKHGLTYKSESFLRGLQKGIKMYAPKMEDVLERHWQNKRPDLVVSLIPNFNGVMFRALRRVHQDVPYVTVMTDMADCPPRFWLEKQEQYVICGSKTAVHQAQAIGFRPDQIFQVSGMILKPGFYRPTEIDRRAERERLGLDPDLPTALIMFGGNGCKKSFKIVKRIEQSRFGMQSIVMCGNNKKLQRKLEKRNEKLQKKPEGRKSCHPVGFVENVPDFMGLADVAFGKPGPAFITESVHCGVPVIIELNKFTMPQEAPNAEFVEQHKVGLVIKSFGKHTKKALGKLLNDNTLKQLQRNTRRVRNQAVFEIPPLFKKIMDESGMFTFAAIPVSTSHVTNRESQE